MSGTMLDQGVFGESSFQLLQTGVLAAPRGSELHPAAEGLVR